MICAFLLLRDSTGFSSKPAPLLSVAWWVGSYLPEWVESNYEAILSSCGPVIQNMSRTLYLRLIGWKREVQDFILCVCRKCGFHTKSKHHRLHRRCRAEVCSLRNHHHHRQQRGRLPTFSETVAVGFFPVGGFSAEMCVWGIEI